MTFRHILVLFICTVLVGTDVAAQSHFDALEYDDTPVNTSTLKARRDSVMATVGDKSVVVFYASPVRHRNNDASYVYRQDDHLLYLTGLNEPNAVLVLVPKGTRVPDLQDPEKTVTVKEILFVQERNPQRERWEGRLYGPEGAMKVRGIEYATTIDKFASMAPRILFGGFEYLYIPPFRADFGGEIGESLASFRSMLERVGTRIERRDPTPTIASMRALKDVEEIRILREATRISALAHNEAMRTVEPGMYEYEVEAVYEYVFARLGAEMPGYPSIVGSGENTCILHYSTNRKKIMEGELVLADCAAEFHGYSSDITRTYPANGRFTKEQRAIYDIVLNAQQAAIATMKPGSAWRDAGAASEEVIEQGLVDLGLVSKKDGREFRKFYWHGLGHAVGLNVHDVGVSVLQPGVIYTVEPGIYIPAGSEGVDERYFNIGVRIEDVVLVTENGNEVLSSMSPSDPDEIEELMKERGLGNQALR